MSDAASGPAPQTNALAAFLSGVIHAAATGGEIAAKAFVAVEAPFLNLPVVRIFTNYVIHACAMAAYQTFATIVTMIVIDVQTRGEAAAAIAAAKKLQEAQDAGDQTAIDKATQDAIDAYAKLVQGDGWYHPSR